MVIGYGPRFADFVGGGSGAAIFLLPRREGVEPDEGIRTKVGGNPASNSSGHGPVGLREALLAYLRNCDVMRRTHFGLSSAVRYKCLNHGRGEVAKWQTRMP